LRVQVILTRSESKSPGKEGLLTVLPALLEFHQLSPQLVRVLFIAGSEAQVAVADHTILIYKIDGPLINPAKRRSVAGVELANRVIVILQERKRELEVFCPFLVSKNVIAADTDKLGVEFRKVAPFITEGAYFGRSAAGPIGDIEGQYDVGTLLVG
jgi:hypothetical protein